MPLTPEQRAQIARENGAKSHGPKTDAGKAKSRKNALKHGQFAADLDAFLPPHPVTLCNEDPAEFTQFLNKIINSYNPHNDLALETVHSIAAARWNIERLRVCLTMHWNLALIDAAKQPSHLIPELIEVHAMVRASTHLYAPTGAARELNRQITLLETKIMRLERHLAFQKKNFPGTNPLPKTEVEQTQPLTENEEPPIYITETSPLVINAYKREYPNRKIITLPPDDVANGVNPEDDMPSAPRKAS